MKLASRASFVVALALFAASCGGGGGPGVFDVRSPAAAGQTAKPGPTVAAGKLKAPAPARMFAGTASVVGQLTRYCTSECVVSRAETPTYLKAPPDAFVVFTIAEAPQAAVAEVRVAESEKPGTVTLDPNTLMVFNHGLGKGKYLVDLHVRWRSSEARWRFGLTIT